MLLEEEIFYLAFFCQISHITRRKTGEFVSSSVPAAPPLVSGGVEEEEGFLSDLIAVALLSAAFSVVAAVPLLVLPPPIPLFILQHVGHLNCKDSNASLAKVQTI